MTCVACRRPCPPPDRPWTEGRNGRLHYYAMHEYDPAKLEAALAHLPVVHEICARLNGMLDMVGRVTEKGRGILIRQDERLRA